MRLISSIHDARSFAAAAHVTDVDKLGAPYIQHLERVRVLCRRESTKVTAEIVALLHDVCEDHPELIDELQVRVSPAVWDALVLLTRGYDEPYEHYIQTIANSGNDIAREVKIADLCDHLRFGCPASLVNRYLAALAVLHRKARS